MADEGIIFGPGMEKGRGEVGRNAQGDIAWYKATRDADLEAILERDRVSREREVDARVTDLEMRDAEAARGRSERSRSEQTRAERRANRSRGRGGVNHSEGTRDA